MLCHIAFPYFTVYIALGQHPTMERSFKLERGLDELVSACRDMLEDFCKKSKQQRITDFINPNSPLPAHVNPRKSTSGSNVMEIKFFCA
jgi:hypothetical protein